MTSLILIVLLALSRLATAAETEPASGAKTLPTESVVVSPTSGTLQPAPVSNQPITPTGQAQALTENSEVGSSSPLLPPELPSGYTLEGKIPNSNLSLTVTALPNLPELESAICGQARLEASDDAHPTLWFLATLLPEAAGAVLWHQSDSATKNIGLAVSTLGVVSIDILAWNWGPKTPDSRLAALKNSDKAAYSSCYEAAYRKEQLHGALLGSSLLPVLIFWSYFNPNLSSPH